MKLPLFLATLLVVVSPAFGEIKTCFSPESDCTKVIVEEINKSRKSVFVQAYNFTDDEISKALIEAKLRGLQVVVLIDRIGAVQRGNQMAVLQEAMIQVRVDRKHKIAHNKIIILDAPFQTGEQLRHLNGDTLTQPPDEHWEYTKVITGSFNFTNNAQSRNSENLVIISDEPEVCKEFWENWKKHWLHTEHWEKPDPKKAKAKKKASRRRSKSGRTGVLEFKPK